MKKSMVKQGFCLSMVTLFVFLAVAPGIKAEDPQKVIPQYVDVRKTKIDIVNAVFVKELEGVNARYREKQPDKYRGLVATLRIRKPVNTPLKLHAPDLSLHYNYGEMSDVVPCEGLSLFSTTPDVERPMKLFPANVGSTTTSATTIKSDVVYVDAFFHFIEPDVRDVHLLFAQPVGASLKTTGWSSE